MVGQFEGSFDRTDIPSSGSIEPGVSLKVRLSIDVQLLKNLGEYAE
jgi:hypothetical protein